MGENGSKTAKGRTRGGKTKFKPGNPGGPGRPQVPEDVKQAREITRAEFARIIVELMNKTAPEIRKIFQDQDTPVLESIVASVLIRARENGDPYRLDVILDRVLGKVPTKTEVDIPQLPAALSLVLSMTPEERAKRLAELQGKRNAE